MEKKEHPSYGMIQLSRSSIGGTGTVLFGSSIMHNDVSPNRIPVSSMARYGFFSESIIVLCRMPLKKTSSVNAAVSIIRQKNTGSFINIWRIFVILK